MGTLTAEERLTRAEATSEFAAALRQREVLREFVGGEVAKAS
jgi:hypothetical protein